MMFIFLFKIIYILLLMFHCWYSEMHLSQALLVWIDDKLGQVGHSGQSDYDFIGVLKHVSTALAPSIIYDLLSSACFQIVF